MTQFSIQAAARRYLTLPTLLRLVPTGLIIVTGIGLNVWTHNALSDQRDLVVHTHEVIETTKDVLIGLDDAETGQRGYLLSGDRRYLDPYDKARERLDGMSATLKSQVADNDAQTASVQQLMALMQTKLSELQASIDLRDTQGFEAAKARELEMMSVATMDRIRHVIGTITEAEKALLIERDEEVALAEDRVRIFAILVALASLLTRSAVELYLARKGMAEEQTGQTTV